MPTYGNNPYAVSSNIPMVTRELHCDCCTMPFSYTTFANQPEERTRCDHCADHHLDGTPEEQAAALREHEPRLMAHVDQAREAANKMERELREMRGEIDKMRAKVRSALNTRDRHRSVAIAVLDEHERQGGPKRLCSCGKAFPCPTVIAAETADPDIATYIEKSKPERDMDEYRQLQWRKQIEAQYFDGTTDA
jgi:hypothetical protein